MVRQRAAAPASGFNWRAALRAWRVWLPGVALVGLVMVAYFPAFSGGYVLDDDVYVTQNPNLHSVEGLRKIWFEIGAMPDYFPLVYSTYWLEYRAWGLNPLGYHAVNICLHAACIVLLWQLLKRLNVPGAWPATAVFAVHPVCVESVAWVTELRNTMPFLFSLASVLCYLKFEPPETANPLAVLLTHPAYLPGDEGEERRWPLFVLSLVLFAAALLCKTQVVGLPVVLMLIYWWKQGSITWPMLKRLSPMFLIAVVMSVVTVLVEIHLDPGLSSIEPLSPIGRVLLAGRALWFYVSKLVWPYPLTFNYPRIVVNSSVWWQYLFPVAALGVLALLWTFRGRIGRGALAATSIFICLLLPVLGFVSARHIKVTNVADHFQYPALMALVALATAAVCAGAGKLSNRFSAVRIKPALNCAAATLIGGFMLLSWRQSRLYADANTLYEDTIQKNPDCWIAHNNLAIVLLKSGRMDEALNHFEKALRIKPDYVEAHANFATALSLNHRSDEAIEHFQTAIKLKPGYVFAYCGLADVYAKTNRPTEATDYYEQALRLAPDYADAHNNLGLLLMSAGRREDAIEHLRSAIKSNPEYAEAYSNLGSALEQVDKNTEAIEQLQIALKLNPNLAEAHNLLGAALATTNRPQQAIDHYRQAVRLNPNFAEARYNLGTELLGVGKTQEAVTQFLEVLRITPNDAQAAVDLATAYAKLNQPAEAVAAASRAGKIARSNGQTAKAEKIEAWIASIQRQAGSRR